MASSEGSEVSDESCDQWFWTDRPVGISYFGQTRGCRSGRDRIVNESVAPLLVRAPDGDLAQLVNPRQGVEIR